jgi:hypothetical protein
MTVLVRVDMLLHERVEPDPQVEHARRVVEVHGGVLLAAEYRSRESRPQPEQVGAAFDRV